MKKEIETLTQHETTLQNSLEAQKREIVSLKSTTRELEEELRSKHAEVERLTGVIATQKADIAVKGEEILTLTRTTDEELCAKQQQTEKMYLDMKNAVEQLQQQFRQIQPPN